MGITGPIPRLTDFEDVGGPFFLDEKGGRPDRIDDDQALWVNTGAGLIICLGCCHAGLVNTLEHLAFCMGRRNIYAVIGGTHLGFCGQEQLEMTISALKDWRVKKVAASHCTGFAASARLSREMAKEFQAAQVGYSLEV